MAKNLLLCLKNINYNMKSLFECLIESIEVNESSYDMLRLEFGSLDKKDETIKSIEDLAAKNGIYSEKIDNGIKLKLATDSKAKLDSIQDVLQQYVDKMQDDDKADESDVDKLARQLDKLSDFIDSDDEEDDKKDDDNNKSDEDE